MSFFKRLINIGRSEAGAILDRMEDPVRTVEQGLRDLKDELAKAIKGLMDVKTMFAQSERELESVLEESERYEQKAAEWLRKGQSGQTSQETADRMATDALNQKARMDEEARKRKQERNTLKDLMGKLQRETERLKAEIYSWEDELLNIKKRTESHSTNYGSRYKEYEVDSSETIDMLERMKRKIEHEEARTEAYQSMSEEFDYKTDYKNKTNTDNEEELDSTLGDEQTSKDLEDLKSKIGTKKG